MPPIVDGGGLGIRIIQIPASVQDNPLSSIYFVNNLLPSTKVSQRIEITNSSNEQMLVKIYPGAATNIDEDFVASVGATSNELTSWVSVTPNSQLIPAHAAVDAVVTFKVPPKIDKGELFGVIWASTSSPTNNSGVTNVNRVGIRMYIFAGDKISNTHSNTAVKSSHSGGFVGSHELEILTILVAMSLAAALFAKRFNHVRKRTTRIKLSEKPFDRYLSR